MNNKKEIQRELWHSEEMAYLWRILLTDLIGYAVVATFMLLADDSVDRTTLMIGVLITSDFAVLPVLVFCLWRTAAIFRKAESCIFQKVRLDRPVGGALRDTVYFKVRIKRSDGKEIGAQTHAIFLTRGYGLLMEDYVNKTVTVAYNEETEILTVIG